MSRVVCLLAVTALSLAGSIMATRLTQADDDAVTRGARLVSLGNGHGGIACASCHGHDGAADPSGAFPRLTGQTVAYIIDSLRGYADGRRRNALMTPISLALSDQERQDVAAYFASVIAAVPTAPAADPSLIEAGRIIANVGLNDQQLPACVSCHGPYGRSVTPDTARTAGRGRSRARPRRPPCSGRPRW